MKKIQFGIALMLFGFMCVYAAVQAGWGGIDIVGLLLGVSGLTFSISGFFEKE